MLLLHGPKLIVHQNVPGKGRHPLARYLNGSNKVCTNLDNLERCFQMAQEQGVMLGDIEKKVLKYVYVLSKVKKIPITALNISYIYAVDKNSRAEDIFKGKDVYIIHYESSQTFAMELEFKGGNVTPFLNSFIIISLIGISISTL